MSVRLSRSGFRSSDMTICARAHNAIAMIIGEGSERAVIRRLLITAAMLRQTAERVSGRDLEAEGEKIADDFFEARAAGARGDDGR